MQNCCSSLCLLRKCSPKNLERSWRSFPGVAAWLQWPPGRGAKNSAQKFNVSSQNSLFEVHCCPGNISAQLHRSHCDLRLNYPGQCKKLNLDSAMQRQTCENEESNQPLPKTPSNLLVPACFKLQWTQITASELLLQNLSLSKHPSGQPNLHSKSWSCNWSPKWFVCNSSEAFWLQQCWCSLPTLSTPGYFWSIIQRWDGSNQIQASAASAPSQRITTGRVVYPRVKCYGMVQVEGDI